MKKLCLLGSFLAITTLVNAATITVTTANSDGAGSFAAAIRILQDGDTIAFNIPGAGPHYIIPPVGGFPIVIKDNVTIDGYSQPGSSRNTNPINAPNNASIQIVLDASRDAGGLNLDPTIYRAMAYEQFGTTITSDPPIDNSTMTTDRSGYGDSEIAILGIYRATNVNIRGLAFLAGYDAEAIEPISGDTYSPYCIAVAHDYGLDTTVKDRLAYNDGSSRNCHINGCLLGIDPADPTPTGLHNGSSAIAAFRHRDVSGGPRPELPNESLIVGVAPGSANPRGEFNVIAYMEITIAAEPIRTRFSGNFLGVFPDGVTGTGVNPVNFSGGFELGRYSDTLPIIIGTDGDGVNDADEGNLFGPLTDGGVVMAFYNTSDKFYRFAGNRIGVAVDGTRWANDCVVIDTLRLDQGTRAQIGSDFDGVSDAVEANIIYNNFPFNPGIGTPLQIFVFRPAFASGRHVSMRGNEFVNNLNPPYSPTQADFMDYYSPFMDGANATPVISGSSSSSRLVGTCAAANNPTYPNILIDVYLADLEGIANGLLLVDPLLPSGLVQGRSYLASFVDNGPGDNDPAAGQFDLDISTFGLCAGDRLTLTATYSQDPAGTHDGRAHTSPFAAPVAVTSGLGTIVEVTTAASDGAGSLAAGLRALQDGDTIVFNIPGAGPHYIIPPVGGFPIVIKDNVCINGYSQPGSAPNTNPINAPNNASVQIVLDASRDAGGLNLDPTIYRAMAYEQFGTTITSDPPIDNSTMTTDRSGYGDSEIAILGIYRATNVNIRGLAFLAGYDAEAIEPISGDTYSPYCIAVAHDYGLDTTVKDRLEYNDGSSRNCHINGCYIGIDPGDPTSTGLHPGSSAIAAFRHRDISGGPRPELPNESLIIGVAPGSANPRGEFNVMAYMEITVAAEPIRTRFSGNFLGVFPDGVTGTGVNPVNFSGGFELGRYNDTLPIIIGTDGDGVNDEDEGNLFGPLTDGGVVMAFYGTGDKPYRFAGNRIGVAVDGTRWTNDCIVIDELRLDQGTRAQFGSDFDGVSDVAEANIVYNNFPFNPGIGTPLQIFGFRAAFASGRHVSMRGNEFVNNLNPPYSPTQADFMDYYSPFMDGANATPVISGSSSSLQLIGTCAEANNPTYPNILIDVYLADPEGIANGLLLVDPLLPNGLIQGKTYLGSFVDNGPGDGDPAPGAFSFNMSSLGVSVGSVITITATYSQDPAGTHDGRAHTSPFSAPAMLATPIVITRIVDNGASVTIDWMGGGPSWSVEARATVDGAPSTIASGLGMPTATVNKSGDTQFYRVSSP